LDTEAAAYSLPGPAGSEPNAPLDASAALAFGPCPLNQRQQPGVVPRSDVHRDTDLRVRARTRTLTRNALASPEDTIHRSLLLALGVVAGVCLFGPLPNRQERAREEAEGRASIRPDEVTRAALDTAIAELVRWIEAAPSPPDTPEAANLRLLALGRPALGLGGGPPRATLAWANLEGLARSAPPAARPAAHPDPSTRGDAGAGDALATLAILLETGIALDDALPLPSGSSSVRRLLELALARVVERPASADPWSLDLLAFAVLGGMHEQRSELVRWTLASLARLERDQRPFTEAQGDGTPAPGVLARLANDVGKRRSPGESPSNELQLSAAVFRAVAVLGEPDLEQRALRHVNALLYRYQLERDVYGLLLARAPDRAARVAVHLEALETLGRLEQALYGAHLTFRRRDRPGPAPRTAVSMRRAARDLIDHLAALRESAAFATGAPPRDDAAAEALMQAATQALRGLRAARVAT
jgi:hypothetical protein